MAQGTLGPATVEVRTTDEHIFFTVAFEHYIAKQLGLDIVEAAGKAIAAKLLREDKELLEACLDRDKLAAEITNAIGRAFVSRLLDHT